MLRVYPVRRPYGEGGFSIIEAVIALGVLSIGLLAIAGMQTFALTGNLDANDVSVATNLSADMMERIRFNWRNTNAYNGIDTLNGATQPPATQPMARGDYTQWQTRLNASGLQNVQGRVAVTATGPLGLQQNRVDITLTWTTRVGYSGIGIDPGTGPAPVALRQHTMILSTTITPV